MSSFTILATSRPFVDKVAVALPGKPIPVVGLPVVAPVIAPNSIPDITPPYMDRMVIYGGVMSPYMDHTVIYGGMVNGGADVIKMPDGMALRVGGTVIELVPAVVDWRMQVVKQGFVVGDKRCHVQVALANAIRRMAPAEIVVPVSIGIPVPGVYETQIDASGNWPLLRKCKHCPLSDRRGYEKFRNLFPWFPDTGYFDIAYSSRLVECPFE